MKITSDLGRPVALVDPVVDPINSILMTKALQYPADSCGFRLNRRVDPLVVMSLAVFEHSCFQSSW